MPEQNWTKNQSHTLTDMIQPSAMKLANSNVVTIQNKYCTYIYVIKDIITYRNC